MKNKLLLMLIVLTISILALTACGSVVFEVTFDLNYDGAADFEVNVFKEGTLKQPFEPLREGYIFEGWFNEEGCTTPFDFSVKTEADRTAYAKWTQQQTEIETCTVNFTGENLEDMTVTVNKGSTAYQPLYGQKIGYELTWYNGEIEYDFSLSVNANITLTARYTELASSAVSVTFKGEGLEDLTVSVNKGSKVYMPALGQKDGHDLTWYNGDAEYIFDEVVEDNLTLTAVWTIQKRTVTLLDYDGEVFGTMEVNYGSSLTEEELTDEIGVPYHEYEIFYEFDGIEGDLTEIKTNVTIKPVYKCNTLPEEIFDFVLLSDGTYGIKIHKNQDFRSLQLTGDYVMPEYFNGKPISTILYEGMFSAYGALNNIYRLFIPETYRVIQNYAFKDFHIYQIVIAEGLEEIWANAFFYCSAIVNLPASINYIEYFAFTYYGMKYGEGVIETAEININAKENAFYKMDGNLLCTSDGKTLVHVNQYRSLQTLIIPESIEYIYPALCFDGFNMGTVMLAEIIINGNIKTIGSGAFANIGGLESVIFNGTVERIEGDDAKYQLKNQLSKEYLPICGAFCNSYELSRNDFLLPSGIKYIGDFAFANTELSSVVLDGNIEHVGKGAFFVEYYNKFCEIIVTEENDYYYSHEDRALIEKSTGINGGDTFLLYAPMQENKDDSINYVIPNGVTSLASHAFWKAGYLNSLTLPEGVEIIPGGFMDSAIMSFELDNDFNFVLTYHGVKELILPSTLKEILSFDYNWKPIFRNEFYPAFTVNCLESISWPNGCNLQKIDYWAIVVNEDLEAFEIPDTVNEYSPLGLYSLNGKAINININNIKYISFEGWIFEKLGNNEIKLIQIPHKSDHANGELVWPDVGEYAITEIGTDSFYGIFATMEGGDWKGITSITFPDSVRKIHKSAFNQCVGIKTVIFPSSLEYLDDYAMYDMYNLESITFNGILPPRMGKDVFWAEATVEIDGEWVTFKGFPIKAKIYIPNGNYLNWYEVLSELGEDYASHIVVLEQNKLIYNFNYNDGTEDKYIIEGGYIFELPHLRRQDDVIKYYFNGWYTSDGTDGNWGEKVTVTPFYGWNLRDQNKIVNLYAKWSNIKTQDGKAINTSYDITEEELTVNIIEWGEIWFEFTPSRNGLFFIDMNIDVCTYEWYCFYFDTEGNMQILWLSYFYDIGKEYCGWAMDAGVTYYFCCAFQNQNFFTGEEVPTGEYVFKMDWLCEKPAEEEYE